MYERLKSRTLSLKEKSSLFFLFSIIHIDDHADRSIGEGIHPIRAIKNVNPTEDSISGGTKSLDTITGIWLVRKTEINVDIIKIKIRILTNLSKYFLLTKTMTKPHNNKIIKEVEKKFNFKSNQFWKIAAVTLVTPAWMVNMVKSVSPTKR